MTEEREQSPSLREEAARWLVRLRSGDATADDRRRFDNWLAEDAVHRREFERVSGMWTTMVAAKPLFETELRKAEDRWNRSAAGSGPALGWPWWSVARTSAAGVLMTLAVLTVLWWITGSETVRYQTAKGEQRQVTLSDGSSVTLNTDTQLIVHYTRFARAVRLEHGEAWFTVSPERQRPFRVQVEGAVIRDIGTQFIVGASPQRVEVSVFDGIVEVALHAASGPPTVLRRGEHVSFGPNDRISAVEPFDELTAAAWKDGKLIFKRRPLAHVLAELGRYRKEEIRLLDQTLADLPVTGAFNIRELDNSLELLQDVLPIRAHRVDAGLIIVEHASGK